MSLKTSQEESGGFVRPNALISNQLKDRLIKTLQYLLLLSLVGFVVLPLLWLIVSSLKMPTDLFSQPPTIIPNPITAQYYVRLFTSTQFPVWLMNSLFVTTGVVILTTVLSTFAGYGLARANFRGKKSLARSVLLTYMYPAILLAIPLYIIFLRLGLINSYLSLILGLSGRALPFAIWLMWQQFQAVPISYEEAAWVDGASVFRTVVEVLIPMVFPSIAAVMVFSFAVSWNEYTIPKVIITDLSKYPITLGVDAFTSATQIQWGLVLSSSGVTIIPGLLLVLFLQKYFLRGFNLQ